MPELKIIREDDIPEFEINQVKVKREAKRKAREEAEKGTHHTALRAPQAEVRLFSMDTHVKSYYGVHIIIPGISLRQFKEACSKVWFEKMDDVEVIVVQFKDKKLAFEVDAGREI